MAAWRGNLNVCVVLIMNPGLTTLEPPAPHLSKNEILSKSGYRCTLVTLSPGDEIRRTEPEEVEEHIVFVADGEATLHSDGITTVLNKDDAILINRGRAHVLRASPGHRAKLLLVEAPARQPLVPPLVSFE